MRWFKSWLGWDSGPRMIDAETTAVPFEVASEDEWRYIRYGVAELTTNANGDAWYRYQNPFRGVVGEAHVFLTDPDHVHLKIHAREAASEGFMARAYKPSGGPLSANKKLYVPFLAMQQK